MECLVEVYGVQRKSQAAREQRHSPWHQRYADSKFLDSRVQRSSQRNLSDWIGSAIRDDECTNRLFLVARFLAYGVLRRKEFYQALLSFLNMLWYNFYPANVTKSATILQPSSIRLKARLNTKWILEVWSALETAFVFWQCLSHIYNYEKSCTISSWKSM